MIFEKITEQKTKQKRSNEKCYVVPASFENLVYWNGREVSRVDGWHFMDKDAYIWDLKNWISKRFNILYINNLSFYDYQIKPCGMTKKAVVCVCLYATVYFKYKIKES